jgi:hypothetical protein
MQYDRLKHRFVKYVPEQLEPGILYISIEYATAVHMCCCGCGEEVVTPFTPTDWRMIFDGESISLWPSIGNWDYDCRSHYVIKRNRVIDAKPWSEKQIAAGRRKNTIAKAKFFRTKKTVEASSDRVGLSEKLSGAISRIRCLAKKQ